MITSAPKSARNRPPIGPAQPRVKSRTRTPFKADCFDASFINGIALSASDGSDCLRLPHLGQIPAVYLPPSFPSSRESIPSLSSSSPRLLVQPILRLPSPPSVASSLSDSNPGSSRTHPHCSPSSGADSLKGGTGILNGAQIGLSPRVGMLCLPRNPLPPAGRRSSTAHSR